MTDELLYVIFGSDALLSGVTDFLMELAVVILVPLEWSPCNWSGCLNTPVYSLAMKTSSDEETTSISSVNFSGEVAVPSNQGPWPSC